MSSIEIGNNRIYMQKKGSATIKDTANTILLGAERIELGIQSGNKEIAKDPVSGLNYERNEIIGRQVYNLKTQKHRCCFVLDLETGSKGWYPGSVRVCDVGAATAVKAEKSDTSDTLITISYVQVEILDVEYDSIKDIWYLIKYNDIAGYVRTAQISNIHYTDKS